jgi:uncharacterized protein YlxW (UPF0749 family)
MNHHDPDTCVLWVSVDEVIGQQSSRRLWRVGVPVTLVLAGLLMATSAATARGTNLRSDPRANLADLIREQATRAAAATAAVQGLQAEIDQLTGSGGGGDTRVAAATAQAIHLQPIAGLTPMVGPGLTVTLDDSTRDGAAPLPTGVSPDDLVVHQQDIQAVVNALWAGGAQGVEVMDQRLLTTSAVRCVGNTLILHGRVYSPPFTVTAVGDVLGMRQALQTAPGLIIYRQWVDLVGLGYQVAGAARTTLPAYQGELDLTHASVP